MSEMDTLQNIIVFLVLFVLFLISLKIVFRFLKNAVYRLVYSGFIIPLIYYYSGQDGNIISSIVKEVIKKIIN